MEKETGKLPWASPQMVEIDIKMTENGGGYDYDIAGEGTGS